MTEVLQIGRVSTKGYCCNKPQGCQMCPDKDCATCGGSQPGCQFPKHPWKLKYHYGEKQLICPSCSRGEHTCPELWEGFCDCTHATKG
jgi:hypothetical protein